MVSFARRLEESLSISFAVTKHGEREKSLPSYNLLSSSITEDSPAVTKLDLKDSDSTNPPLFLNKKKNNNNNESGSSGCLFLFFKYGMCVDHMLIARVSSQAVFNSVFVLSQTSKRPPSISCMPLCFPLSQQ